MKKLTTLTLFLLITLLSFSYTITGKVIKVSDGDTIVIMSEGVKHKIRLNSIDCPEKKQEYGQEATKFTYDFVYGKTIEADVKDKDRYGRLVADIYLYGDSLNQALVRNGLAWHYKKYSKDKILAKLEELAREENKGLWKDQSPIAPWDYRKGITSSSKSEKVEDVEHKESAVYVTKSGKKYHREGCSSLRKSKKEITIEEAIDRGYEACSRCEP